MEPIYIRYGEPLTLPLDAGDVTASEADIYIGRPGTVYILTKHATLTNGVGVFEFSGEDTQIPLGTYYYQVNIDGDKYPSPDEDCEDGDNFPEFVVREALDLIEVS